MAWPPAPSAAFLLKGVTTIEWGTDGILSTYTVKSIRDSDTLEVLYIENGTGLRATRIILWQGRNVDITVVADTTFTHPSPGSSLTLTTDPLSGGSSMTFTVVGNEMNASRKEPADRVISATFETLIEGAGNVPPI